MDNFVGLNLWAHIYFIFHFSSNVIHNGTFFTLTRTVMADHLKLAYQWGPHLTSMGIDSYLDFVALVVIINLICARFQQIIERRDSIYIAKFVFKKNFKNKLELLKLNLNLESDVLYILIIPIKAL